MHGAAGRKGAGERDEPGGAAAGGVHAPQGFPGALAQAYFGGDGGGQALARRADGVPGEPGEGGVLDQVADGDRQAARGGHEGDTDGGQGAAADAEEVVVDTDPGQAEDLAPDLGEDLLGGTGGGGVFGVGAVEFGRRQGQRPLVGLAAAVDGHLVEDDEPCGHHVAGQGGTQRAAQFLGGGRSRAGDDEVGDEGRFARQVGAVQDHRLPDVRQLAQGVLDLPQLDAESAQFDLRVAAAQPLHGAVGPVGAEVAGAAQAVTGGTVGVGDVGGGGQGGPAEVAAADGVAAEADLTGGSGRDRLEVVVQDVDPGVAHRRADGRTAPSGAQLGGERPYGGLGEAVDVLEAAAARPQVGEFGRAGLAGHLEHLQAGEDVLAEDGEGAGRQHGGGDARLAQGACEVGTGAQVAGGGGDQAAAVGEGPGEFQDRGVESERGELQDAVLGGGVHQVALALEHVGQAAVRDAHALGCAGGARGVDDVGEGVGAGLGAARHGLLVFGGGVEVDDRTVERHGAGQRPLGQQHPHTAVLRHEREPLGGVLRVQRQERAAGAQHADGGTHQVGAAFGADADHRLGSHAESPQPACQLLGLLVQFGVREALPEVLDGGGVRGAGGVAGDVLVQEQRGGRDDGTSGPVVEGGGAGGAGEGGPGDTAAGVGGHGLELGAVHVGQLLRGGGGDVLRVGVQGEGVDTGVDQQREHGAGDLQGVVPGVVGEAVEIDVVEDGVGQPWFGGPEFGDADQGHPAVRQHALLGPEDVPQVGEPGPAGACHSERHGVEEQTAHPVGAGQFGAAVGDQSDAVSEHVVAAAGEQAHGVVEGGEEHRAARHARFPGEPADALGEVGVGAADLVDRRLVLRGGLRRGGGR